MSNFLKNILEENNFQIEEITDDVLLVKDFFSKEDLDKVINLIKSQ